MNFLTGDDEVTCDKDFKHAIKCLHGLTMRDSGIEILGFLITVPIFRQHLPANGLTTKQINSYLNPNDKQDVPPLLFVAPSHLIPSPCSQHGLPFARNTPASPLQRFPSDGAVSASAGIADTWRSGKGSSARIS
jgi:hypothetical protein